ncbi:hypothetical protein MTP99_011847 [Tenebrio molitor]|nr:hypothetical protein MTP99_011847 [Tenebrio molitor]
MLFLKTSRSLSPTLHKILILAQLLALILMCTWHTYGKIHTYYKQIPLPILIIDILRTSLLLAICLLNPIITGFLYHHQNTSFFATLQKTDPILGTPCKKKKQKWVKTLTYVMIIVTFGCDASIKTQVFGFSQHKYNLVHLFYTYISFTITLRFYDLANAITNRFLLLHQKINTLVDVHNDALMVVQAGNLLKCYYTLCKTMDTVSQLYGWQILLIEKMIVLHLVYTMYYIYLLFHTMTIWLFVIVNILWAAGCFLHGYLIVFSCDDTNKSAQAVLLLSQNLAARTKPDSQVRKILEEFCRQIGQGKPEICCPLGLPIDRKLFCNIVGNVFNSLIIVFQFDS